MEMQIKVNLKLFVIIILFFFTNQIKIYGILMLFALLHELGHLIIGIILGFKPVSLSIKPVGLSIGFDIDPGEYNNKIGKADILILKKLIITIAGPIVNLIFIIIYIFNNIEFFGISREFVIYSNILIGIFNLIPIYPLDGGRIIKNCLHIIIGIKKTYKVINIISNITIITLTIISSIAILYFENIAILIIIIYLWFLFIKYRF